MPAYVISQVSIRNPDPALSRYAAEVPATVAAFGGRYVVLGKPVEVLEGSWERDLMVVIEFPDQASARAWYESEAYRPLRELRKGIVDAVVLLADGAPDAAPKT